MQRLEVQDILHLGVGTANSKAFTLSFYAKAPTGGGTFCAGVDMNGGGVYFEEGTGKATKEIYKLIHKPNQVIDEVFKSEPRKEGFLYRKGKMTKQAYLKYCEMVCKRRERYITEMKKILCAICVLVVGFAYSQDITVLQINAEWNKRNN